ncbi:hypothetical protein CS063_09170 [Sporanaerobium hydrogeniformans]|uniref:Uncharacterized protein n=1 Tax=Sporanaerobium hydrogeniformans TaxID=3072179 RepID=A0AC61DD70_9FIRM|nr:MATE family efflux transporter [Sporanaerobium hydrogeniformans]PHV70691.1 hypothetical protein CS063_09170 [Sporanaerobium hydrogeniformans]
MGKDKRKWQDYTYILQIAIPLILATGYLAILEFFDRMFLAWYSKEALAAVTPASALALTCTSLFTGILVYVGNIVSQYYGAKMEEKIGSILWQGIWLTVLSGVILVIISCFSEMLFKMIGHDGALQPMQILYFEIITKGAVFSLLTTLFMSFYASVGKYVIVGVTIVSSMFINVFLDYCMIFGKFGFKEMGVKGSALSTIIGSAITALIFIIYLLFSKCRKRFHITSAKRIDIKLFQHIFKYSLSNGVVFFLDSIGFTLFLLLIGRAGVNELAASNVAVNISNVIFLPVFGFGMAISIIVGECMGKKDAEAAKRYVRKGFCLVYLYVIPVCLLFWCVPELFVNMFVRNLATGQRETIMSVSSDILKIVAIYTLFDAIDINLTSCFKGAGDVVYVMYATVFANVFLLMLPVYVLVLRLGMSIYVGWGIFALTIIAMSLVYTMRYKSCKWQKATLVKPELI